MRHPLRALDGPWKAQDLYSIDGAVHADDSLKVRLVAQHRLAIGFGRREDEIPEKVLAMEI